MALPKTKPTKILFTNFMGESYEIHLYQTENAAYFVNRATGEVPMKYSPVNQLGTQDIAALGRKAVRYLASQARDRRKFEAQGFSFMAPGLTSSPLGADAAKKKKDDPSIPKWL